jgi:multiple sugar transport system permease protein
MKKENVVYFAKKIPGMLFKVLMAVLILLPVGWMFFSAFRSQNMIIVYPPEFFPKKWSLENFAEVMNLIPIWLYFKNTVVFAGLVTFFSILINSLAGYAFARMEFKGKNAIFTLLMASMMIPFQVIMVPLFIQIHYMGMLNKLSGLVIPRIANVVGIFFMRSFFLTLPKQLEEAGRLDGLRELGIFFRIMLPNCGPAVITQVIMALNFNWNDLMWPLLMTSSPEKRMLSNGICFFIGQDLIQYGPAFAAGVISVIPLLAVFIFGQKYFVNSIVSSAIKG